MTILTFPPVGGKLDKVPLIGDAEVRHGQTQAPPSYHPKFLETGDGGLPNSNNSDNDDDAPVKTCYYSSPEYRQGIQKMVRITAILFGVLLILYFAIDTLCKSYAQELQQKQQDTVTEDDATVPYKSYSSYAAAESDMLSLPSSPEPSNVVIYVYTDPSLETVSKEPITISKSARFLHDFSINITGIIDFESQRCYVMPLLRNSVEPPESLYDMLVKMSSGYYSMDINKILSNFCMVKPAISDLSDYGLYISKDCADYPTFKLEKDIVTESP
ncbi:integral membrane protein 2B-like [Rhopalosiphum maidis]|uniref:integral membrane protein 2B-like n=1 Tax=Rhopalosiphum maidis TaxID=43146 RepID=UPI000EFEA0A1|nr:integral membrane protein 2B-like [Rhopalosiphum maidis]